MCERPPESSVTHIRFGSVFRFGSILGAIGAALSPGRIGIAMFTLALLVGGGRIWDAVSTSSDTTDVRPFNYVVEQAEQFGTSLVAAMLKAEPTAFVSAAQSILWDLPSTLWTNGNALFVILFGLWTAATLAFGGGLLCRLEAVAKASHDREPLGPAMAMVISRWTAFFGALVMPLVLAGVLAFILLVFGLLFFSLPVMDVLGGLFYGVALVLGLSVSLLLLGFAVSCPLLLPAVATENCDGPDAMHRAIAYVVACPLRWLLYLFTILLGLAMGLLLVLTVSELTVYVTGSLVNQWASGESLSYATAAMNGTDSTDAALHTQWAGGLVAFWMGLVQWVVAGWSLAYVMSASTRAYLLLRLTCDGQDEREIWWPGLIRGTLAPKPPSSLDHVE
jgi:hypothetical protein